MEEKKAEFQSKYEEYLQNVKFDRASLKTPFSAKEEKANQIFLAKVKQFKEKEDVNLYNSFYDNQAQFEASEVYKIIKKMPKGIMQHIHLPAAVDFDFLMDLTREDFVFFSREEGILRISNHKEDDMGDGYVRLNKLRQDKSLNIDKEVADRLYFDKKDSDKRDVAVIFEEFGFKFNRMGSIMFYKPNFVKAFDNILKMLAEDNYQGVELRHVYENYIGLDFKQGTIDEELEFFHQQKQRLKGLYPGFGICFMCTPVKVLNDAHFLKMAEYYVRSMEKYKGLITGFDAVHFEETKMLIEYVDQILELKDKNPGFEVYLHAGESNKYSNKNIAVAVLLGSKRIGHGLISMDCPTTLKLLKKHDVCVEVNPISNNVLGYCKDFNWHPAKQFINFRLPITINPDDFTLWKVKGGSLDFFIAAIYWDFDLRDLKWCIINSLTYSSMEKEELKEVESLFYQKWEEFIDNLIE